MKVSFLVNGLRESAMAERARGLSQGLGRTYRVEISYRERGKFLSLMRFFSFLARSDPDLVYVLDIAWAGAVAALLARPFLGFKLIVDTGDLVYELDKLIRVRTFLGIQCIRLLEKLTLRAADAIVVRGSFHKLLLKREGYSHVLHIPDGVDPTLSRPLDVSQLRKELGLDAYLTIGVVGSTIWSERLQMCYGWELIEVLKLLRDCPVKAILVGDGTGLNVLKSRASEERVENGILFVGAVPYGRIPHYVNLMDICISTQTDNLVGQVRTTGKLPEYLACGRYVLATEVGEAKLILPEEMLVPYHGVKDMSYPRRLAKRIQSILKNPQVLKEGLKGVDIARSRFDYRVLGKRLETLLRAVR